MEAIDQLKMPMHAWEGKIVRLVRAITSRGGDHFPKGATLTVEHTYRGHLNLQASDGRRITRINRRCVELVTPLTEMPRKRAEWRINEDLIMPVNSTVQPVGMTARSVLRKMKVDEHYGWFRASRTDVEKACADADVECSFR